MYKAWFTYYLFHLLSIIVKLVIPSYDEGVMMFSLGQALLTPYNPLAFYMLWKVADGLEHGSWINSLEDPP